MHGRWVHSAGTIKLAVMTRASLGHTGQALVAGPATRVIYAAIVLAAAARLLTAFDVGRDTALPSLGREPGCWRSRSFAISFGPLLVKPRLQARLRC